jgi:hypothetical protein
MPKPIEGVPVYGWEGILRLRMASAVWAREVLADTAVALVATRPRQYWREVYAADLAGTVLLGANVRYRQDIVELERHRAREELTTTSGPADVLHQAVTLTGRRLIAWRTGDIPDLVWLFNPEAVGRDVDLRLAAAPGDDFGKRYDNFVGQLSGTSYRWHPTVAHQPSPWEPHVRVAAMRAALDEMAMEATSDV